MCQRCSLLMVHSVPKILFDFNHFHYNIFHVFRILTCSFLNYVIVGSIDMEDIIMGSHCSNEDKYQRQYFQTKPLIDGEQQWALLAMCCAAVVEHCIPADEPWYLKVNKGSLTLHSDNDSRKVITMFIDTKNNLAQKEKRSLSEAPIVVGIDLVFYSQPIRSSIRDSLQHKFGALYRNPEKNGCSEWRILPDKGDHPYDILFIQDSKQLCATPLLASKIADRIKSVIIDGKKNQAQVDIEELLAVCSVSASVERCINLRYGSNE